MKIFPLTLFLYCLSELSYAQHLYINVINGDIYEVNPDYSLTLQTTVQNYTYSITDIAISPAGIMYGVAAYELIQIDLVTGNVTVIKNLPHTDNYVSLVCDQLYNLYFLSGYMDLYRYNILEDSLDLVANLGDNTPGDLSFYKGNLIYQSAQDENIKAYNLQNGILSTIQCRMEPLGQGIGLWGLSNLYEACTSGKVFAIDNVDNLYELDLENDIIYLRKHYEQFGVLDINGMASTSEYLAAACDHIFENVECTTTTNEVDVASASIHLYPNPAEESITMESNEKINFVSIFDLSGKLLRSFIPLTNRVDVNDLSSGIYFFHIYLHDQVVNKKILIR